MTHDEIRARIDHSLTVSGDVAGVKLLEEYVVQQEAAERERQSALTNMTMQRDVFCEKLNEYIDKTKEAEKRAEAAEQEVAKLRATLEFPPENNTAYRIVELEGLLREERACKAYEVEQARAEGYERGRAERVGRSYCGLHIDHWGMCCRRAGHADECLAYGQIADPKQNPKGLGL